MNGFWISQQSNGADIILTYLYIYFKYHTDYYILTKVIIMKAFVISSVVVIFS